MIGAVENAIVGQLRAAGEAGVLGYEYRTLETFPDEFDAYLSENGKLRVPAAWAVFLGLVDGRDEGDLSGWSGRARFALVVAAQNMRNEQDTRHGDGAQPGSYQLTVDAIRVLSRNWLEPDVELEEPVTVRGARLVAISPEMKRQGLSLVAIDLECRLPFGEFAEEQGAFETLHVDWDVPALGNVAAPLPAANPDAEDLIEVPQ